MHLGEFALGPGSRIWQFWPNYTFTTNHIILGEYNCFSESRTVFNQRAPLKIIEYNPLWLYEMDDENIRVGHGNRGRGSISNTGVSGSGGESGNSDDNSVESHQNPKLNHERKLNILTRHHIFPRGSFVVKGIVNRKEYFIVLNFESYTSFLPKNLKKEQEFEIIFYEDENDNADEKICNYPMEYYLDTGHRRRRHNNNNNINKTINEINVNKTLKHLQKQQQEQHQSSHSHRLRNCLKSIIVFNVKDNSFFTKNDIDYNILYDSPSDNIIMLGKSISSNNSDDVSRK